MENLISGERQLPIGTSMAPNLGIEKSFICICWLLLLGGVIVSARAQGQPKIAVYSTNQLKTESLKHKLSEAHGSVERWKKAPSLSFMNEVYDFSLGINSSDVVDIYNYKICIKPKNSVGYASFKEDEEFWVFFDGKDIGSVGLSENNNNLKKSPPVLLFSAYALISLPWLVQMKGVDSEYVGMGRIPMEPGNYEILKMSFSSVQNDHKGFYELFIDPKSGFLKAVRQTAIFPKLPGTHFEKGVSQLPMPIMHVFKSYSKSNGLTIPTSYTSYLDEKLLGIHFIQYPSFEEKFDESFIHNIASNLD